MHASPRNLIRLVIALLASSVALTGCSGSSPDEQSTRHAQPNGGAPAAPATTGTTATDRDPTTGKELYDLLVQSGTTHGRLVMASQTGGPTMTDLSAADLSGHAIGAWWACTSKGKGLEVTVMRGKEQVLWGGSDGCSDRWMGITSPSLSPSTMTGTLKVDHSRVATYVFCLIADDQVQN